MKIKLILLGLLLWSMNIQAQSLTLSDCIETTLNNNPRSTVYAIESQLAKEKIREAKSSLYPSASVSVGFNYYLKLQTVVISGMEIKMGNKFTTTPMAQIQYNILDPSRKGTIESAKINEQIVSVNTLKNNEELVFNTINAYYEALTYLEQRKLLIDSEERYKQLLEIMKVRYELGVEKKSEYSSAKVNLYNVQTELEVNSNNYELAMTKLKNAMGLDLATEIEISYTIEDVTVVEENFPAFEYNKLLDFKLDSLNTLQIENNISMKKKAFYPTLSVSLNYGLTSFGSEFFPSFTNWFDYSYLGLNLNVPIFSGFRKKSQLEQARLDLIKLQANTTVTKQSTELAYRNAQITLKNYYKNLVKTKEIVELAQEVLDARTVELQEGKSTMSNYLNADYSYKEAKNNYISALLKYYTAKFSVEKSRGNLINYIQELK